MHNVKFKGTPEIFRMQVKVSKQNLVRLYPPLPEIDLTAGFEILTEGGRVYGNYLSYKTIFREMEDGSVILSNDGSVWTPPETESIPKPEPYVPTLQDVQEAKIMEMNMTQQYVIQQGINVTLTDGRSEHFTLTDHDQTSLVGLQSQVLAGEQNIPWHSSDQSEHCKFYSNADMALITAAAMAYVTWHVTYFRDLRIYIRSLTAKEDVEKVFYGMDIPEKFQSEVLKELIQRGQGGNNEKIS